MKQFSHIIADPEGIHARPAGMLVKVATGFSSKITIGKDGKDVDLKRILAVMSLGCKKDQEVIITIEGEDEEAAQEAIQSFLKENM